MQNPCKQKYNKVELCRICGGGDFQSVINLGETPIGGNCIKDPLHPEMDQDTYPLALNFCNNCFLLQLDTVVNPELIYSKYLYTSSISLGLKRHFENYAVELIEKYNLKCGAFIVEIGCNDGLLLEALKNHDMKVLGFDPATETANSNNDRGIETVADYFNETSADAVAGKYGAADLVIANNVMANIPDLKSIMKAIHILLSDKGDLVVESGYFLDTIEKNIVDNVYHEHLSYFGVRSIQELCNRTNFRLNGVQHVNTKGGSMRYFINKNSRSVNQSPDSKIEEFIINEKQAVQSGLFNTFSDNIKQIKKNFRTAIEAYKQQGLSIAGYGASVGAMTLLYYFEMQDEVAFLYDDNAAVHGYSSPESHILIKESEEIYSDNVDVIIIFCWRYADTVVKKHNKLLALGKRLLLPLPMVKEFKFEAGSSKVCASNA